MSKVAIKGMDIPLDQIKPSPYQPRLNFDLEDIRESIKRDGILIGLTVRKKEGDYELIDGERRLRLAKELGYETVPCDVVDIDDETARRMVYKVNKARKNYTPYEEAVFFRKLVEEEGMKPYQVETQLTVDHHWVQACLNIWKMPKNIQDNVFGLGDHPAPYRIYMSDIYSLESEILRSPDEAVEILRQIIENRMTADEKRELIGRRRKKIDEETVAKATEVIEKIVPEIKPPETPEELEEAAKALRKEAERRKTPEQKKREAHQKKVDAVLKSLLSGKASVPAKIEKAKELGLDTTDFEARMEAIKEEIDINPEGMKDAVKELKTDIDEARKEREAEIEREKNREAAHAMFASFPKLGEHEDGVDVPTYKSKLAEIEGYIDAQPDKAVEDLENLLDSLERDRERERIREEERKKAGEKRLEDLVKEHPQAAQEAIIDARTDQLKRGIIPQVEELSEEEVSELKRILEDEQERIKEKMKDPKIRERGRLFKDLMAHGIILQYTDVLFCPSHPEKTGVLKWSCCDNSVEDAYKELSSKF